MSNIKKGLELLREPFKENQISKKPVPTKRQTEMIKADYKLGVRCKLCGSWHHPDVEHLDYVGHAALTDRLLDADPKWYWEPLATKDGLPLFDSNGGLWIKLTVDGVTRLGYGNAEDSTFKETGSREKEVIGDALRNAAMRFGAALDLWHKGKLHSDESGVQNQPLKKIFQALQKPIADADAEPPPDYERPLIKASNGPNITNIPLASYDEWGYPNPSAEAPKPINHAPKSNGPSEAQIKRLHAMAKQLKWSPEDVTTAIKQSHQKNKPEELTREEYTIFTSKLQVEIDKTKGHQQ